MCVKSFSKDIESHNDEIRKVIECFQKAEKEGLKEITIPYLIKNTRLNQVKLYDCMHTLLDLDVIDIKEYSICPQCLFHNTMKASTRTKCARCKSVYSPDKTIEKLKINR